MDGLDNPSGRTPKSIRSVREVGTSEPKKVSYTLKYMPLWGKAEDFKDKNRESFQWPAQGDLTKFTSGDVHLKELKLKSALHDSKTGICSVRAVLSNGESSGDINVLGVESNIQGCLRMPDDPKQVKRAKNYADEHGVYNIYLMDKDGKDICHYDPKKYTKLLGDEHTIEEHEEIIGVYGTHPRHGDQIFSSFGFIIL